MSAIGVFTEFHRKTDNINYLKEIPNQHQSKLYVEIPSDYDSKKRI